MLHATVAMAAEKQSARAMALVEDGNISEYCQYVDNNYDY